MIASQQLHKLIKQLVGNNYRIQLSPSYRLLWINRFRNKASTPTVAHSTRGVERQRERREERKIGSREKGKERGKRKRERRRKHTIYASQWKNTLSSIILPRGLEMRPWHPLTSAASIRDTQSVQSTLWTTPQVHTQPSTDQKTAWVVSWYTKARGTGLGHLWLQGDTKDMSMFLSDKIKLWTGRAQLGKGTMERH